MSAERDVVVVADGSGVERSSSTLIDQPTQFSMTSHAELVLIGINLRSNIKNETSHRFIVVCIGNGMCRRHQSQRRGTDR